MRKCLTIPGLFFIILIVLGQTVVPWLAQAALQTKLSQKLATNDVAAEIATSPAIYLLLGKVDTLNAVAHQAKIGQVYLSEVSLKGTNVRLDMESLLTDKVQVKSADSLQLKGIINADNLREVLARKIDKIENVQVTINKDDIIITANMKIFGRMADIEMVGQIAEDSDAIYFRMTHLNIKNALIGTAKLGDIFGNVQLVALQKLPWGLKIKQVKQTEGAIIITAQQNDSK